MEIEEKYNMVLTPRDLAKPNVGAPITAERWMSEVRRLLRRIEGTKVGPMLLSEIRRYNRWVSIEPYWSSLSHLSYMNNICSARATPVRLPRGTRMVDSVVQISPERLAQGTPCATRRRGGATADDHEILFHELVHAMRMVSDKWGAMNRLGGGLRDQDNFEEFVAVLVTNIYASHNGKPFVRAGHRDHSRMRGDLADSFRFFEISTQAYPLIKQFYADHPNLGALLTTVEVPFNPIWAYWKDADKARRLSEGAKAKRRDATGDALILLESLPFSPIEPGKPIEQRMPR
jgi:hypothetical protein